MKTADPVFRLSRPALLLVFAPLVAIAYFIGLNLPLLGPDEPRYAQVAREMFERGDLVTPTLGGLNWFEKPALLYWLEIAFYNVFGVTEFAARLGSALFGLGTIAALWYLGRLVEREEGRPGFATTMAVVGASTVGLLAFSHGASFDIILAFPMTAALVAFYVFDGRGTTLPLILFYVFIGLGLLAKGLIGIVFPFAIVALYCVVSRRSSTKLLLSLIWGTALAALIAATWYLPMYMRHGYEFVDEFIIQHHFQRFTSNKYQHPQPFYFFFWILPLLSIPWFPFAFRTVWREVRGQNGGESSLVRFAICWLIVPLIFFSFSGSKLPGYILPAVPPMIVLAAVAVRELGARSEKHGFAMGAMAILTLVSSITILLLYMPGFARNDSVKSLIAAAGEAGYADRKVAFLHQTSHNAEFYAAGRLIRETGNKTKRFGSPHELADTLWGMRTPDAIVLVPPQYAAEVAAEPRLTSRVIAQTEEFVAIYVERTSFGLGGTP